MHTKATSAPGVKTFGYTPTGIRHAEPVEATCAEPDEVTDRTTTTNYKLPTINYDGPANVGSFSFIPTHSLLTTHNSVANTNNFMTLILRHSKFLLLALALMLTAFVNVNAQTATVSTDKADYAPRSNAVFTGSGFSPNETVVLKVKNLSHACNTIAPDSSYLAWSVVADDNGAFVTNWTVCDCNGDSLRLKATGQTSGMIAYALFTDATTTTSIASGNWNAPGTWACNCIPGTNDDVTIAAGHTVTVNVASDAKILTVNGTLNVNSAGNNLTVKNTLTVNNLASVIFNGALINGAAAGVINAGANLATTNTTGFSTTASTGSIAVTGGLTYMAGVNYTYNGATNQSVGNALASNAANLTISNTGGGVNGYVSLAGNTTITGILNITAGILDLKGLNITVGSLTGTSNISNLTAATAPVFTVGSDNTSTSFSGVITNGNGTGTSLTKIGSGTLTLNGSSIYSGTTTLTAGTLAAGINTAFGASTLAFNGGSILASGGARTLPNAVTINSSAGTITGSNALTFSGNWTLLGNSLLNVNNTASTTINGIVDLNNSGSARSLIVNGSGNITFGGVIKNTGAAAGSLTFQTSYTGTAILNNANTYSGTTTFNSGSLILGNKAALGSGNLVINSNVGFGVCDISANTDLSGANAIPNNVTSSGSSQRSFSGTNNIEFTGGWTNSSSFFLTNSITGPGVLKLSGPVNLSNSASNLTLALDGAGNTIVSGVISNGGTSTASTLINYLGTVTLSGNNTYGGTTTAAGPGGVIQLGAAERINNSSNFILSGGIFQTGETVGFSETVGTLNLTAASTIALGTGNHTLTFANSSALTPWGAGATLNITGWGGTGGVTNTTGGKIFFSSPSGLTSFQLAKITFAGYTGTPILLNTGELVPPVQCISGTWLGTTSTNWFVASNWCGGVPTATTDVIIPSGGNQPTIGAAGALARNVTINNGATLTMSGSFNLSVDGDWSNSGTFTPGTGTVTFTKASGIQTVNNGSSSLNNLTHSGAGTLQLSTSALSVVGAFTNSAGTFDANGIAATYTGLVTLSGGSYLASTATQSFNGNLTVSGGTFSGSTGTVNTAALTLSSGSFTAPSTTLNVSGNWFNSGAAFAANTGTVNFTQSSGTQPLQEGSNFYNFNHTGAGTLNGAGAFNIDGAFTNSAGIITIGGYLHTFTGLATISGGTYQCSNQKQTFNGGITVSGTGTFAGSNGQVNVTDVNIGSGATFTAPNLVSGFPMFVFGNWTNSGTFNHNNGYVYIYGAAQTIGGDNPTIFNTVEINGTGEKTITNNVTIGSLSLLRSVTTGSNVLTVLGSIGINNAWIKGNLSRLISPTASYIGFPVGDANGSTTISVKFDGTPPNGGYLTASTSAIDPTPGAQPSGAGLSATKYVKRRWVMLNNGVTGISTYSLQISFLTGDIQNSADYTKFVASKLNGSTWTPINVNQRFSSFMEVTGLTSFSEFALGEPLCIGPAITVQPSNTAVTYGNDATFNVTATGTAPLTYQWKVSTDNGVNFNNVSGANYSTNSSTGTLTITKPTVSMSGYKYEVVVTNSCGNATTNGLATLTVNKATLTITANPQSVPYGTAVTTVTGAGAYTPTGFITGDNASVIGGSTTYTTTYTATTNAGTAGITITPVVTSLTAANYNFTAVTGAITVTKVTPVITWSNPADIDYGTALSATELNATSGGVAGNFVYSPALGTILNAGNGQLLSVQFTPSDATNYNTPSAKTATINVLKATPVITWTNPADIIYGTALGATQLNATSGGVAGNFVYTPASGTILNAGNGQLLSVQFTPTDVANYNTPSAKTATINVQKASSTVTVTGSTSFTYNASAQGPGTSTHTGSTGAITYSYSGTPNGGGSYGPSATAPTAAGSYSVTATLAADNNFNGAVSAPFAFTIDKASSTVTVIGSTSFTYNASAQGPAGSTHTGSTGAITYSYSGTPNGGGSYGPSATAPTVAGSYSVTATLAADNNFNGAVSAPFAFTIDKASSTVTVTGSTSFTYNALAQGPSTSTTSGSTGSVTYSYSGTANGGAPYAASPTKPTLAGSYSVTATLAADNNFNGAVSDAFAFSIDKASSTVTVTGSTSFTYNASAQGPDTSTHTGSTGAITYSYSGTPNGGGSYGPLSAAPTAAGSYSVTATLASDNNFSGAVSDVFAFTIDKASSTVTVTGSTSFTYNASAQGPGSSTHTGSTGAITYSYSGTPNGGGSYGPLSAAPTAAGSYSVTATLASDNNFNGAVSAPFAFTIDKASSTVTVTGSTSFTYNASAQGPGTSTHTGSTGAITFSYSGTPNGGGSYGPSATAPTAAGSYSVTATLASDNNFNGAVSAPFAFTIDKASSTVTVTGSTSFTYNASAQGPGTSTHTGSTGAITFSYSGTPNGGGSYGPSATAPTAAGSYSVTATLASDNNFNGAVSAPVAFTIDKASSTVTVTGSTSFTYNGSAQGPGTSTHTGSTGAITFSYSGTPNGGGSYGPTATAPTAAGSYSVTATLAPDNNFNGAVSAPFAFTIDKASSTVTVTGSTSFTYNASAQGPAGSTHTGSTGAITFSYSGTANGGAPYAASSTAPTAAGSYSVTATLAADNNFNGAVSAPFAFTIDKASSTVTVTGSTSFTYNGSAQGPGTSTTSGSTGTATYSYSGTANGGAPYAATATKPTLAGSYSVTATLAADNNFNGAVSAPFAFSIDKASSTVTVTGSTSFTYNASAQGPGTSTHTGSTGAITFSYSGTPNGGGSYGPSATAPTAAGSYSVTATLAADNNFNGAVSAPFAFTIDKASSTVTVTGSTSFTYNGSAQGPGTSTHTGSTGAITFSYSGTPNGGGSYGPTATAPTAAGSYSVTATLAPDNNFNGAVSAPFAFTIDKASSTVTVTGSTSFTYSGSAQGPSTSTTTGSTGTVSYSYSGTPNGGGSYGPSATAPTAAGSYSVTATLAADNNFNGAVSDAFAFSIDKASSTVTVTGSTSFTYNASAQGPSTSTTSGSTGTVTYSYSGTANGGAPYAASPTAPTAAGSYSVTATLAADNNFNGAVSAPFAFTIDKASSTVTVTGSTSFIYSGSAQGPAGSTHTGSTGAITFSYSGTANGGAPYAASSTKPTLAGSYSVTATLAADNNFNGAVSAPFAFTIDKASSTVTVTGSTTFIYSGSAQGPSTSTTSGSTGTVTYSYTGTANGGAPYAASPTAPTAAGSYSVTATLAADNNFNGAVSAPFAFTIDKASSTVTVTGSTSFTYNASAQGPSTSTTSGSTGTVTYSYSGTANGGAPYAASPTAPTAAGSYSVTATLAADNNFNGAVSAPFAFTIDKASSTVTVTGSTSFTYNTSAQGPSTSTTSGSTGAVTYSYSGTANGGAPYAASPTKPTLAGSYSVTATLAPDNNFNGAVSAPFAFTIDKASSTVTVTGSTSFTYNASAQGPAGSTHTGSTGAITFSYSGTPNGGGSYGPLSTAPTAAGSYSVTATLAPDNNFNGAVSATFAFTIDKGSSTVTVTGSTSFTYNASAQGPGGSTHTGSTGAITFSYSGTPNGGGSYGPTATAPTAAGSYSVTATLAADNNFNGAVSAPFAFTIDKATPVITWSNPADINYGTPLSGTQLNATTTIPGAFVYAPPAGTVLGGGNGQTLSTTFTPTDVNNYNSNSKNVVINVLKSSTIIVVTSALQPSRIGESVTFTATITPAYGFATGTVTFKDGANTIGSAQTLTGASNSITISTSALTEGVHSITAVYSGDVSNLTSTSNSLQQTVYKTDQIITSLDNTVYCEGDVMTITFKTPGKPGVNEYTGGNVFSAQVSNPGGNFVGNAHDLIPIPGNPATPTGVIHTGYGVDSIYYTLQVKIPLINANTRFFDVRVNASAAQPNGTEVDGTPYDYHQVGIVINELPTPTLTSSDPNNTICHGEQVTFTAGGGTMYEFFVNGTSQGPASATTTFVTTTLNNQDIVTVNVTNANGCSKLSSGITTTVNALPTPTLSSSDNTICAGGSVTFTAASGASNYKFFINGAVTPVQDGASNQYTTTSLANNDIVTVKITNSNGCSATSSSVQITVNPKPSILAQTPAAICSPGSVTLTASDFTGTKTIPAGTTYSWSTPVAAGITGLASGSNQSSFATGTLTNTTNAPITVVYTLTPTGGAAAGSCTGSTFTISVVVNPKPSIANQTPAAVCSPGSVALDASTFTGTNIIPAGTTYSWSTPVAAGITGLASGSNQSSFTTGTLTNTTNAPITVVYTLTPTGGAAAGSCTGSTFTVSVVVNPKPSIANQTPAAVCSPGSVTLDANTFTGTNIIPANTTYSWSTPVAAGITGLGSGSNQSSFTTGTLTNTTNAPITVVYTLTPTGGAAAGSCTGSTFTVSVVVNPKPSIANQTTAAVCSPGSVTLLSTDFTGSNIIPAGTTYSWSTPVAAGITGLASGSNQSSFTTGTLTNTTNAPITVVYTLTPTGGAAAGSCTGSTFTISVVVNPKPSIANQTPAAVCSPGSVTLDASTFTGTNIIPANTTYSWSAPVAAGITGLASGSNQSSFTTGTLTNTTNAQITVVYTLTPTGGAAAGSCTGSTFTISVVVNPKPYITAQTPAGICNGGSVTLTASTFTGTNIIPAGTTYTWALPVAAGITGLASGSNQSSFTTGTLTNTTNAPITVVYTLTPTGGGSCTGSTFTVSVVVNPKPSIANQTPAAVCSPGSVTLDANTFTGTNIIPANTTYSWSTPVAAGITGLGSGSNQSSFTTGTLTNTTNAQITVVYTLTPTGGAAAGSCTGSTFTISVVVNPKPSIANQTPAAVCSPGSVTLDANTFTGTNIIPANTTYSWSAPVAAGITGLAPGSNQSSFTTGTLTNTTNAPITVVYTLTPTGGAAAGSCTGSTFTISVVVNPKPSIANQTPAAVCSPGSVTLDANTFTGTNIIPANTTYSWSAPVAAGITGLASGSNQSSFTTGTLTNTTNAPITVVYTLTPTGGAAAGSCTGSTFTISVVVNPKPYITAQTPVAICTGASVTLNSGTFTGTNIIPAGTTYTWALPVAAGITGLASGSGQSSFTTGALINTTPNAITVTYTVYPTGGPAAGSCAGAPFTVSVVVKSLSYNPTSATTSANNFCADAGGTLNLAVAGGSLGTGAVVKWYSGSCGGTYVGTGSPLSINKPTVTTTYFARYEGDCNTTDCAQVTVTVNQLPVFATPSVPAAINVNYSDAVNQAITVTDDGAGSDLNITKEWKLGSGSYTTGLPTGLTFSAPITSVNSKTWTIGGNANVIPGVYTLHFRASDIGSCSKDLYITMTVSKEDLCVNYNGQLSIAAVSSGKNSCKASIPLSVGVSDLEGGDVRNVSVQFYVDGVASGGPVPVQSLDPVNNTYGNASKLIDYSFNGTYETPTVRYEIISNYYQVNSSCSDNDGNVVIDLYLPQNEFITGGGYIKPENSVGVMPATNGLKANFGFNVKYTKSGTNLQGNINYIFRQRDGNGVVHTYQVKGNAMTSLTVNAADLTEGARTAVFNGKCNVSEIINGVTTSVSGTGNSVMQVIVTDAGEPGTADKYGITVWNSNNQVYHSSNWVSTATTKLLLGGGNIQVSGTTSVAYSYSALTSSLNPSNVGNAVTFKLVVSKTGSANPTGTVTFKDGAATLGTGTLSTTLGITSASITTSALAAGTHNLSAVYNGDVNYGVSAGALTQVVNACSGCKTVEPIVTQTQTVAPDQAKTTIAKNIFNPRDAIAGTEKGKISIEKLSVKVMPNPSRNYFTLVLSSGSNEAATIRVVDVLGRSIDQKLNVNANGTQQLGTSYRPGVYIAEIRQGNDIVTVKLIKQ